ncbi:hypothetical protein Hokovirus_3_202 [Hokovirus HKV1]|uniref:Uncharacterized protein n=1 Tax=Hokovirus HKV1 TaxID=1977638 RepID=A0A1V0SGT3_9VIRU|nr:hypothetical protein Hokovirus_3_202 [Hokovirus HKV1]
MDILLYGNNIKLDECSEPRTFTNKNINNDKFIKIDNFVPVSYFLKKNIPLGPFNANKIFTRPYYDVKITELPSITNFEYVNKLNAEGYHVYKYFI